MAPPPMTIHKNTGKGWSNGAPYGTLVQVSDKGYINKDLFLQFGHSFVSFLHRENLMDGRPHLVVLDSHYSHLYNVEFLELMRKNNICSPKPLQSLVAAVGSGNLSKFQERMESRNENIHQIICWKEVGEERLFPGV